MRRALRLGLTGSIGMGKSETAGIFRALGVPVYDADAAVHALYARGGAAVAPVADAFPGAVVDGAVDRARLRQVLRDDPAAWPRLEALVHPLVRQAQARFVAAAESAGAALVVLDIPLLFETGGTAQVDYVVVVSAPPEIQRARVLQRPGMTEDLFAEVLARQLPDAVKRAGADFVIATDRGLDDARSQAAAILARLRSEPPPRQPGRLDLERD